MPRIRVVDNIFSRVFHVKAVRSAPIIMLPHKQKSKYMLAHAAAFCAWRIYLQFSCRTMCGRKSAHGRAWAWLCDVLTGDKSRLFVAILSR